MMTKKKTASKTARKTGKPLMKEFPLDRAFTFFEPGPVS